MVNRHTSTPWLSIIKLAWIVLFTFSLYMLGMAMVQDHYSSGGQDHHNWHAIR
jgi:hypothetical protein